MKKLLNTALSIILTVLLVFTVVWAQTGSYTTNNYFYLPEYGAYGTDEYDAYNAAMEVADNQIQSNKESIETIEADYLVAADLTGYYTKLEIDAFGYISDLSGFDTDDLVEGSVNKYFPGFTSLLADYGFTDNSTEWDLAYGWGDHAAAGYLTTVALNDISDVNTTGVADGKIIKYDIATSKWIIADDEDTGTTYTAGTGLDLTGTVFSLDASAFDLNDFPADPDADRYLFWNDTTGALTWAAAAGGGASQLSDLSDVNTSTPTDKYVLVADGVDFESRQLTSDDLSDVDSIAMLDEYETVTGDWIFSGLTSFADQTATQVTGYERVVFEDEDGLNSDWTFRVAGNSWSMLSFAASGGTLATPTISDDYDCLGMLSFLGYDGASYLYGAEISASVDGTPGSNDMPGRLEFFTTPDGSSTLFLRMAIDNAGNIKMGDGAWTNYVNIDSSGNMTFEGDATLIYSMITIAADDTTPDVSGGSVFITSANTGATAITDLDNPTVGETITIIGGSDTNPSTIADSGNFKLSGDMTLGLDDSITLFVKEDNYYIELSRSDN